MNDKRIQLSRRQVLGGLGTIGVATAGAGLGTTALFSDEESFNGNTIQAGEFTLTVELLDLDGAVDQDGMGPDEDDWYDAEFANGEGALVGVPVDISDLKPGDTYEFCWCIHIQDNPGFVRAFIPWDKVQSLTGPEAGNVSAADIYDIDSDDDFEHLLGSDHITVTKNIHVCGNGEKGDAILAEPITYEPDDGADYDHDGGLGNWVSSLSDYEHSRQDGVPIGSHDGVGHRKDGDLEDGTSDYIRIGSDGDGLATGAHFESVAYCVEIHVGEEAGNELQGAELSFDLQFLAEQARHNDHPFSSMATRPLTDTPTDWSSYPI